MNNLYPGSDLEGDARESADLNVGLKNARNQAQTHARYERYGAVPQAWRSRWPASQLRTQGSQTLTTQGRISN
jgi:hypothetical protein